MTEADRDDLLVRLYDNVASLNEKMGGFDEKMAGFDEKMAGFDEKMAGFDEKMAGFDEKMAKLTKDMEIHGRFVRQELAFLHNGLAQEIAEGVVQGLTRRGWSFSSG